VAVDRHVIAKGEHGGGLTAKRIKQKVQSVLARKCARLKQDDPVGGIVRHGVRPVRPCLLPDGIRNVRRETRHHRQVCDGLKSAALLQAIQKGKVGLSIDAKQNEHALRLRRMICVRRQGPSRRWRIVSAKPKLPPGCPDRDTKPWRQERPRCPVLSHQQLAQPASDPGRPVRGECET